MPKFRTVKSKKGKLYVYKQANGKWIRVESGYGTSGTHKLVYKSLDKDGNVRLTKTGQEFYNNLDAKAKKEFIKYAKNHHEEGITESRFESHLMDEEERFFFNLNVDREKLVKEINTKLAKQNKPLLPLNVSYSVLNDYVEWSYDNDYTIRVS